MTVKLQKMNMKSQRGRVFGVCGALRVVCAVATACLVIPAAVAQERTHDITPEDYFTIANVIAVAPSPNGGNVAYVEMRWQPPENRRNLDLWVVNTAGKRRRLTFDFAADTGPQWSNDSRWIYFASARKTHAAGKSPHNGKRQVWRIRPDGSGLVQVTRVNKGVGRWQLAGDGASIYYEVRKERWDKGTFGKLRKQHKQLKYGHGNDKFSELFQIDLSGWRTKKLVAPGRVAREWRVSPDGQRIAMLTTPDSQLVSNEGWSRVDIFDTKSRKTSTLKDDLWRKGVASPYGWILGLAWSTDSSKLAFRVDWDGYPGETYVAEFGGVAGSNAEKHPSTMMLPRPKRDGMRVTWVGGHMQWRPGTSDLCLNATFKAIDRVHCVTAIGGGKSGPDETLTENSKGSVGTFAFARDDKLFVFTQSTLTHPPDIFAAGKRVGTSSKSPFKRLTVVNPQVDRWKLPTIRDVWWKSKDGTLVHGILELPPGHVFAQGSTGKDKSGNNKQKQKRLPLVVEIHGGPTSAVRKRLRFWIYGRTLFAAKGWALLSPNYRGSTGFGDKFMVDLIGHKNDLDVDDILAGVDKLVADGIVDDKKMAVMGWSNGGYLTNCVIARTTRFKAASSGAGVFDSAMQWMIEDTPGHVVNFNQGLPWMAGKAMMKSSPLYNAHKIKTPTLIHVGEKDARVPVQHSRALFRSLYRYLKVPAELVVYPGEPHGLGKHKHRKAKMLWDIAWFEHYVLGKKPGRKPQKKTAGKQPKPRKAEGGVKRKK